MSLYDNNYLFLPLSAAQLFFRLKDQASNIEVMVDDPDATAPHRQPRS